MRINVQVPESHAVASSSLQLDGMPAPLVRIAPTNELVLIELQGNLEIDNADPEGGQVLAKLEFHPGREDVPTLLVSHHRLEGKLVSLTKPMAVLEMKRRSHTDLDHQLPHSAQTVASPSAADLRSSPSRYFGENKESAQTEQAEDDTAPASPTLTRKRGRAADDDRGGTEGAMPPSSSPLVRSRMPGSEADFSSPLPASKRRATSPQRRSSKLSKDAAADGDAVGADDDEDDDDAWLHKPETATYMEVVCIIRKKLLFSKRPEPVVRLDIASGLSAKDSLGGLA